MDLGLKGKVAVVTGSSRGIGRAIAFGLASEGVKVTICARGEKELFETASELREETGVDVLPVKADLTISKEIKKVVSETVKRFETIHILVNNTGGPPPGGFLELSEENWVAALNLNLLSVIRMCREAAPYMVKQRWGRIINILSVAAKQPVDNLILSNTARAGVIGFSKTLSRELARYNVLVNNVCPGPTMTRRLREVIRARAAKNKTSLKKEEKKFLDEIPLRRFGKPEEIANLVVFLSSEKSSFITGATIQVDGGYIKGNY